MICEKCGNELLLYRRDTVEDLYHTDEDGDQADWIEEEYQDEHEKWYTCGCETCPYVPKLRDDGGGIVAELREEA